MGNKANQKKSTTHKEKKSEKKKKGTPLLLFLTLLTHLFHDLTLLLIQYISSKEPFPYLQQCVYFIESFEKKTQLQCLLISQNVVIFPDLKNTQRAPSLFSFFFCISVSFFPWLPSLFVFQFPLCFVFSLTALFFVCLFLFLLFFLAFTPSRERVHEPPWQSVVLCPGRRHATPSPLWWLPNRFCLFLLLLLFLVFQSHIPNAPQSPFLLGTHSSPATASLRPVCLSTLPSRHSTHKPHSDNLTAPSSISHRPSLKTSCACPMPTPR